MDQRGDTSPTEPSSSAPGPCPGQEVLARFAAGLLAGEDGARVGEHLDTCQECRVRLGTDLHPVGPGPGTGADPGGPGEETVRLDGSTMSAQSPAAALPGRGHGTRPLRDRTELGVIVPVRLVSNGAADGAPPAAAEAGGAAAEAEAEGAGMPLASGSVVDHFVVKRLLGRGGMGEVYLARDTRLGRLVALKVVHPDSIGSEQAVAQFVLEARATARFRHPTIVTIYEIGHHRGMPYMALEYVQGQTLRDRMATRPLEVREAVEIGLGVAEALEQAHRRNILHRDLKPANVMLPDDGGVRVLDFGLAKVLVRRDTNVDDTTVFASLVAGAAGPGVAVPAETVALRGTPAYMAPEQWRREPTGPATDVWLLGQILFEMVARRRAFDGNALSLLAIRVCGPELAPPLDPAGGAPPGLAALVARCLDKEPEHRPSAAGVVQELRHIMQNTYAPDISPAPGRAPAPAEVPVPAGEPHPAGRPPPRFLALLLGGGLVVLGGIGALGTYLAGGSDTVPGGAERVGPRADGPAVDGSKAGTHPGGAAPRRHVVAVQPAERGTVCRVALGGGAATERPCVFDVPRGESVKLLVLRGGRSVFSEAWTVRADRTVTIAATADSGPGPDRGGAAPEPRRRRPRVAPAGAGDAGKGVRAPGPTFWAPPEKDPEGEPPGHGAEKEVSW